MRAPPDYAPAIRNILGARGIASSAELQAELGVSQPTISRALQQLRGDVLTLGAGPSRRYALRRAIPGVGADVPVYSISPDGAPRREGVLHAIASTRFWMEPTEGRGDLFASLPWFALDQRPEGYLGRALARAHQAEGYPPRLSDWNDDQVLRALTSFGGSARGDLVFGDAMLQQAQAEPRAVEVRERKCASEYPRLAAAAAAGDAPGSSAGGEQPKFEAIRIAGEAATPVIVKFTPPIETPVGRRWRDLLMLEHLANEVLRDISIPTSASKVIDAGGRTFMEVERFDRVGTHGRRRVFSLGMLDDRFIGRREAWGQSAASFVKEGMLPAQDAEAVAVIDAFGRLIGNSDMHFGNLSFFAEGLLQPQLRLAPVYDMSPMRYAPTQEVAAPLVPFEMPAIPGHLLDAWPRAREAAIDYWRRAGSLDLERGLLDATKRNAKSLAKA